MPASRRPRRLHHWGSNALIIAQECTARGLRCLHLHVQEHNSKMRASQGYPRRHDMHASKGYPRRHDMRASKVCPRRPACARPRDARVGHVIRASAYGARRRCPRWTRHPRVGFPRVGQRWPRLLRRVQRCTRRSLLAPKMAASRQLQGSRLGHVASFFQATFSPTMRSNVKRGFGYK